MKSMGGIISCTWRPRLNRIGILEVVHGKSSMSWWGYCTAAAGHEGEEPREGLAGREFCLGDILRGLRGCDGWPGTVRQSMLVSWLTVILLILLLDS